MGGPWTSDGFEASGTLWAAASDATAATAEPAWVPTDVPETPTRAALSLKSAMRISASRISFSVRTIPTSACIVS